MKLDQNSFYEDNRGETFSPWCSYSDMFCSLLMIFVLLFVFVLLLYVNGRASDALEIQRIEDEQTQTLQSETRRADDAEDRADRLVEENAGLQKQIDDKDLLLESANQRIDRVEGELEDSYGVIADQEEVILGLRGDLEDANTQLEDATAQLEDATTQLEDANTQLEDANAQLEDANTQLEDANAKLEDVSGQLADTQERLDAAERELDARDAALQDGEDEYGARNAALQQQLDEANDDLDETRRQLGLVQDELDAARLYIEELEAAGDEESRAQAEEIALLRGELEDRDEQIAAQAEAFEAVAGIRVEIISEISAAMEQQGIEARVDPETGAIVLSSELLFGVNEAELRPEGKAFLREFFPVYFDVLTNGESAGYIAQIIVEGHTDTTGDYLTNLDLSTRRAQSVITFCLSLLDGEDQQKMMHMISASGCSFANPIYAPNGSVDMDRSRRVEVKFTLKDEYMIEEIQRIIEN